MDNIPEDEVDAFLYDEGDGGNFYVKVIIINKNNVLNILKY